MYEKLDPLSPAYLVRRRSGDIVGLVTSDIETVEYFFAHTIAPAFVAVTVPGAVLVTLAIFQWPLAIILLPFLFLVALTPFYANKTLDRVASRSRQQLGEINAHMVDSVQGMRENSGLRSRGAAAGGGAGESAEVCRLPDNLLQAPDAAEGSHRSLHWAGGNRRPWAGARISPPKGI